jgi:hypothetical protein
MLNLNASGFQMLLKAMGVDPQVIAAKAAEFELLAKQFTERVATDVTQVNLRLANLEAAVMALHLKMDALAEGGSYAGESSAHLLPLPTAEVIDAVPQPKPQEKTNNGRRNSRVSRTHRDPRSQSKSL